ncbi:MAG: hypothetical protein RL095_3879 [Verrucomicrobiota bacterium]
MLNLSLICSLLFAAPEAEVPRRDYGIPMLDLARQPAQLSVVDKRPGQYLGQPTSVLFADGKTLLAAYPDAHGHGRLILSRSVDAGKSWVQIDTRGAKVPEVPTLYKLSLPGGRERVLLVTCHCAKGVLEWMWSDDRGDSWSPRKTMKLESRGAIVALASLWPLPGDGAHWRGVYHDFNFDNYTIDLELVSDPAAHGAFDCRFSALKRIDFASEAGLKRSRAAALCEAGAVISPDGKTLALLFRPQNKKTNAMISFSSDAGASWSDPKELPGALSGERHTAKYTPDGRLVVFFRDFSLLNPANPSHGDWVAWVGRWEDLVKGGEGQYRIRLHRNYGNSTNGSIGDCGYSGVEVLPDGEVLAISYGHWDLVPGSKHPKHPDGRGAAPYILQARFKLSDTDRWVRDPQQLLAPLPSK